MSNDIVLEELWKRLYEVGTHFTDKPRLFDCLLQDQQRTNNKIEIIQSARNKDYYARDFAQSEPKEQLNLGHKDLWPKILPQEFDKLPRNKKRCLASITPAEVCEKENIDSKVNRNDDYKLMSEKGRHQKPYRELNPNTRKKKVKSLIQFASSLATQDIDDCICLLEDCLQNLYESKPKTLDKGKKNLQDFCVKFSQEPLVSQSDNPSQLVVLAASNLANVLKIDKFIPVVAASIDLSVSHCYKLLKNLKQNLNDPPFVESASESLIEPVHRGRPKIKPLTDQICTTNSQLHLLEYLTDNAPVKSGSRNYRILHKPTFKESWTDYCDSLQSQGLSILGYTQFRQLVHSYGIHCQKFDEYSCPYCQEESQSQTHQQDLEQQFVAYADQKRELKKGKSALIFQDYCRIHEVKESSTGPEKKRKSKLSICGFVLIWWDEPSKSYKHFNADFFSRNRQKSSFLTKSLTLFMSYCGDKIKPEWEMINFWADGATRTHMNLFNFFLLYKELKRINNNFSSLQLNFFPPYHGHNQCDAHFGAGKVAIRRDTPRVTETTDDTAIESFSHLPYTRTFRIEEMLQEQTKFKLKHLSPKSKKLIVPVKSFFAFKFEVQRNRYRISVLQHTMDPTPIHDNCQFFGCVENGIEYPIDLQDSRSETYLT